MQSIGYRKQLPIRPEAERIHPRKSRALSQSLTLFIGRNNADCIGRQLAQIDVAIPVDCDAVRNRLIAVALNAACQDPGIQTFIDQIVRLYPIKTESMHRTEINPFVVQVFGDRVDADMRPNPFSGFIFNLNRYTIDDQIDISGNNVVMTFQYASCRSCTQIDDNQRRRFWGLLDSCLAAEVK